jgi:hypothetical protein
LQQEQQEEDKQQQEERGGLPAANWGHHSENMTHGDAA